METNPQNPNLKSFPDAVMLDLGDAIRHNESELMAIDPVVETLVTRFRTAHEALEARLFTRLDRQVQLPPLRATRETCKKRLVHALGEIWSGVATVESGWANPRSKDEVRTLRSSLFRYGKPNDHRPGSFKLIEMATTVSGFLAGGSSLARAWPPDEVAELRTALAEYTDAFRTVRSGVVSKVGSVAELDQDRSNWMVAFVSLRDLTLNLTAGRADVGRWKALFTDNRPGRPAPKVEEDPGPPDPPPPDGPTGDP